MYPPEILKLAKSVLDACDRSGLTVITAESCTGGLIAGSLTSIPGSSHVFERGFVTYANKAKVEMLGVPEELIARHGAVSEPVARSMAEGALGNTHEAIAVAVTGIAGPGGGTPEKPVGLVHIAAARLDVRTYHERVILEGDRDSIRLQTVSKALAAILLQIG